MEGTIAHLYVFLVENENEMIEKKGKGRLSVFVVVKHMSFQPSIQYVLFIMFPSCYSLLSYFLDMRRNEREICSLG